MNHYKEVITTLDLAKFVDRTPNYVSKVFKAVTGQSPVDYHQYVRVSRAKELLLNTSMSIAEIAEYLGYCDQFYFSKVFKKITGLSPSWLLKDQSTTHEQPPQTELENDN